MKHLKLLAVCCLAAWGMYAQAQTEAQDTLVYSLEDNEATLTQVKYLADSTLVIPETTIIDGVTYEVTKLNVPANLQGIKVFPDYKKCKKIVVPKTVKTIQSMGHGLGTRLDSMIIAKGSKLRSITGRSAISRCNNLNLPASLKECTSGCITDARNVTLEMDSVPDYCLYQNTMLENVVFSPDTKHIGKSAFSKCRNLKNVDLPATVESIEEKAFPVALTNIVLPASVKSIGNSAFTGAITVSALGDEPAILGSGVFAKGAKIYVSFAGYKKYSEAEGWKDYTLMLPGFWKDNVSYRPTGGNVVSVTFCNVPDDGTLIIPATVEYEGISFKVTAIEDRALSCGARELIIEAPLTKIGEYHRFSKYLTTVKLPDSLTIIPSRMFEGCSKLESIDLPDELKRIEDGAFKETSISQIEFPEGLEYIGDAAFYGTPLQGVKFPEGLEYIGSAAFYGTPLQGVKFPESLKTISGDAFAYCDGIKEIKFPANLKLISDGAFAYTSIENVTIPAATDVFRSPFYGCRRLKNITVESGNSRVYDIDGVLFETWSGFTGETVDTLERLLAYPCARTDRVYRVPEGTGGILSRAFEGTTHLHSVIGNEGLTSLGDYAISRGATSVEYVYLPSTIKTIVGSVAGQGVKLVDLRAEAVPACFEGFQSQRKVFLCVPEESAEAFRSIPGIGNAFKVVTKHVEETNVHYVSESEGEMTAVCGTYNVKDSVLDVREKVLPRNLKDPMAEEEYHTVKRIADNAFHSYSCAYDSVRYFGFPPSIEHIGTSALNFNRLEQIIIYAGESPYFTTVDGVLYDKDTTTLVKYPSMRKTESYVLPQTVDSTYFGSVLLDDGYYLFMEESACPDYPMKNMYILNKNLNLRLCGYMYAPSATLYIRKSLVDELKQSLIDDYMQNFDYTECIGKFKNIVELSDEEADGILTGINKVPMATAQESTSQNRIYTLSGVQVKHPSKGLYIRNGKKIVIK